jgi:hypothetical protein
MLTGTRLRVLDPVQEAVVERARLAARLSTLDGKVLGLYNNGKLNAERILELIGGAVGEQYALKEIVRGSYNPARAMRPGEWVDVERCDAIVLANGD